MIPCPSCHQQVEVTEQNHGTLFTCPHCNAVYFVGWDGQFEITPVAEPEADPESTFEPTVVAENVDSGFVPPISDFTPEPQFENNEIYESEPQFQTAESIVAEEPQAPFAVEESFTAGDAYVSNEPTEPEVPYDFSKGITEQVVVVPMTPDTSDFSDVESFGNTDTTSGVLAYTVVIEGIESHALLKQLKEAMSDSKFGWDVDELLTRVGGGRLTLPRISPTKASVLISRIKYLPLKISWRQDVFPGS